MSTVAAPVSHLRENPFEIAQQQLHRVADTFKIDPNLISVLKECKKAVVVSVPVVMDDGTDTMVPVSRRNAPAVRRALDI